MGEVYPLLQKAGYLVVKSNSGRILVDGKPYAPHNEHIYCWAIDGSDIEDFGKRLRVHAFNRGIGFRKPVEIRIKTKDGESKTSIRHIKYTIFDHTVTVSGRVVYDGQPTVLDAENNSELSVMKANSILHKGGVVDTKALPMPSAEENKIFGGKGPKGSKRNSGSCQLEDYVTLTLDVVIECQFSYGDEAKPLRELVELMKANGIRHLRCESPFRPDSAERRSEAAFIEFQKNGDPYCVDFGETYFLQHLTKDIFKEEIERAAAKKSGEVTEDDYGHLETMGGELVDAFVTHYTVEEILVNYGYVQKVGTNQFCHPTIGSADYTVEERDGWVYTTNERDPLFRKMGRDPFGVFAALGHGDDVREALKYAGDNLLVIDNESWNKEARRRYAQKKSADGLVEDDDPQLSLGC
jgi:hypothetical protein